MFIVKCIIGPFVAIFKRAGLPTTKIPILSMQPSAAVNKAIKNVYWTSSKRPCEILAHFKKL